ncbi:putative RDD family membrane protein YckC [Nocardia transvalensis]|uniref:Putative RDD family membrane protein YckC n=1 Tax=Nocardia transvalensis TaxID=37333 RepID=A0A7W9UI32_9NOCA|nr:RDD family protein [Nocardia transvalensis]MBB5913742.1 putative RDD family membrane protein YckC [Nocardia transvalensis]
MAVFTTGEAVALDLPIARIPTRAAAFLLDVMLQLVAGWLIMLALSAALVWTRPDPAWFDVAMLVTVVTVLAGYPITCETLLRGRTVGKLALGLRVVRGDGGPIDFRHAVTRGLAGAIVDFWALGGFGAVAVVTSLCSPRARRVGDVLAGTVVVHDRVRMPMPALAVAPPWLQGWVQRVELSGLTEEVALPVRQYLTRCRTLTPEAQHHLGEALVTAVCRQLRVPPPPGYPPLQVLGAIIAERQRRTLAYPAAALGPALVPARTRW